MPDPSMRFDNLLLLENGNSGSLYTLLQTVWDPLDITLTETPTIAVSTRLFSKAKFTSLVYFQEQTRKV